MSCRKDELDEKEKRKKEELLMFEMILMMESCCWSRDVVADENGVERHGFW
jgi:hypothetical protein